MAKQNTNKTNSLSNLNSLLNNQPTNSTPTPPPSNLPSNLPSNFFSLSPSQQISLIQSTNNIQSPAKKAWETIRSKYTPEQITQLYSSAGKKASQTRKQNQKIEMENEIQKRVSELLAQKSA